MIRNIYEKLNMEIPSGKLKYDEREDQLVYIGKGFEARISNTISKAKRLTVLFGGKNYEYHLRDEDEACAVIKDFHKGRIKIEQKDKKNILVRGLLRYRNTVHSTAVKVVLWLVGLAIIAAAGVMITAGFLTMKARHFDFLMDDIGLFILLFCVLYCGLSLIIYSLGRVVYEGLLFSGVFILGFGICFILFGVRDLLEGKVEASNFIASVVLFMIFIIPGAVLIRCSYFKKDKIDASILRTPLLPSQGEFSKIYDILYKEKKVLALKLEIIDKKPRYAGSRAGGYSYSEAPSSSAYTRKDDFVMQINLSDIKVKTKLPESGMLQFFLGDMETDSDIIYVEYLPYVDNKADNPEALYNSRAINIIPIKMPDLMNITIDDFYYAASMAGVLVSDDLELSDLIGEQGFSLETEDYLLGPVRFIPKLTAEKEYEKADQPLLSLGRSSEISCPFGGDYLENIQVFISKKSLYERDFSEAVSIGQVGV